MAVPENLIMITPGVWIDPTLVGLPVAPAPTATATPGAVVLGEEDRWWHYAGGGDRQASDRQWGMGDIAEAAVLLDGIDGKKAGEFFSLVLQHPGQLFTTEEIVEALPDVFGSAYAIAGSLNGFRKHCKRANRVYPFHWWEGSSDGTPTSYAVRPSVAAVFAAAGRR